MHVVIQTGHVHTQVVLLVGKVHTPLALLTGRVPVDRLAYVEDWFLFLVGVDLCKLILAL
jgi:hypothetical protein